MTHAVDEACDHEDWVEVPLLVQVAYLLAPEGEGEAHGVPAVLDDPVEGEGELAVEQDLDQERHQAETAAGASGHVIVKICHHQRLLGPETKLEINFESQTSFVTDYHASIKPTKLF